MPACGHSQRMGRPKLLLPWGGGLVIDAVLSAWLASSVDEVAIVVRVDDVALQDRCRRFAVRLVTADSPPDMRASIELGLDEIESRCSPTAGDVWLLAPADIPDLSSASIDVVLQAHDGSNPQILAATYAGRRGHPALFPWSMAAEVRALDPSEGVNALMDRRGWRGVETATSTKPQDIDTPGEYERHRPQ